MILSSSDILFLLTRDPILAALTVVKIVDGRPSLDANNNVSIYIQKYPKTVDLEASWDLWIVDTGNEPIDIILAQLKKILPRFEITENGQIIKAKTTELLSSKTDARPEIKKSPESGILDIVMQRFDELKQSIEDRMLLVGPGRPGKDGKAGANGKDGLPGKDGTNGKDLVATNVKLGELSDVFIDGVDRGQVLTFDGIDWVPRFVPQVLKSGAGGGVPEPPNDGKYYVRIATETGGQWVDLLTAIQTLNLDAGNFDG